MLYRTHPITRFISTYTVLRPTGTYWGDSFRWGTQIGYLGDLGETVND